MNPNKEDAPFCFLSLCAQRSTLYNALDLFQVETPTRKYLWKRAEHNKWSLIPVPTVVTVKVALEVD